MLLTVFYVAATWMQSRRLSSIRRKIVDYLVNDTSIACYKVQYNEGSSGEPESTESIAPVNITSTLCKNKNSAMVQELLWFSKGFRGCTLYPQQIVDVDNWILFSKEDKYFPFQNAFEEPVLSDPKVYVLIEADMENTELANSHVCNLSKIGIPKVWRADDRFSIIIESDVNHLPEMLSSFMLPAPLILKEGFQIKRIQTENLAAEQYRRPSLCRSASQWKFHVELLQNYTTCADEAAKGKTISVPGQDVKIMAGTEALKTELEPVPETSGSINAKASEEVRRIMREEQYRAKNIDALSSEIRRKSASVNVLSSESSPQSSNESSVAVSAQSTPIRQSFQGRKNTFSSLHSIGSASTASIVSGKYKPPNVLVYSESPTTTENMKGLLSELLHKHKYTIYSVTSNQLASSVWTVNCSLLVICGNVPENVERSLISYLLRGGKLLCLCSTFLHTLLPTFRTAEVRERELVRFTYGRWSRVRLMHHVFCYQNSPARTKFSREADEPPNEKDRISPVPQTPSSVEVVDSEGVTHTLHVQVLGAEETWQTPSLLLAYFISPGGRAVFSQVHLELNPSDCSEEHEEEALRHSDVARKEIIKDLLSTHLGLECANTSGQVTLTVAYFLGRHELKLEFLNKMKHLKQDGVLRLGQLGLKFCGKGEVPPPATPTLLPILVHSCPHDFSTLEYFENLHTESIGRLLIYCEILGSSMDVINGELAHGLAVVPSQQTSGKGRTANQWLSPPGCAMYSLQIHLRMDSYLGSHPSVLQHAVSVAMVSSIYEMNPQFAQVFDLRLKWPNDIYIGDGVKIGGVIATCIASGGNLICNVGAGINLDNEAPTTCLNHFIQEYNKTYDQKLKKISREKLLAGIFTQLEKIINEMQAGSVSYMYNLYYRYWLHGGAEVKVVDPSGNARAVTIHGIDENGFLEVREATGRVFSVHPDGNSFDMLEGLIIPKIK
ncbi:UNVERIFIED_CONTAM: hypothetical protein PYX00_003583 [Menopon gallinae]|uniref:BPL/LPL catalytic domain-containing protein n=1 Tax=Menopon gallinae TaxID=328185 RepID=A0AAW2I1Q4_9NEOP